MIGRRLLTAGAAAALALLALTSGQGSSAAWHASAVRTPGEVRSGSVNVTGTGTTVQLHSRQPVGSRTYASTRTCTPPGGFTECRQVEDTLRQEALIPGDQIVVTDTARVAATGTNLTGTLEVTTTARDDAPRSAFTTSADRVTTVTSPQGASKSGNTVTFPVTVATGAGVGDYTVRTVITTPTGSASAGAAHAGEQLDIGTRRYTFTQS